MSESEPTPPTPAPSSAAAAASSSPGSTSSARASQKATKRRRSTIGGMACVVAVVILLWTAALTIPMPNGFLYGGASGASVVMLVYIALIIAKRRGHDTFAVRGLERRKDERDRATSQRAWALAGVVGLFGNVVAGAVGAFGGSMKLALMVVLWLQLISFIGGNIYFNRTM